MINDQPNLTINVSEIGKLRLALIILTIIQIGYYILMFISSEIYIKINFDNYGNLGLGLLNFSVAGVCLWYNWKKLPLEKKKKMDNTWMILFLGVIGMWLWIPNKQE